MGRSSLSAQLRRWCRLLERNCWIALDTQSFPVWSECTTTSTIQLRTPYKLMKAERSLNQEGSQQSCRILGRGSTSPEELRRCARRESGALFRYNGKTSH